MDKLQIKSMYNKEIFFERDGEILKRKIYDPYINPYIILDDQKVFLNFIDLVAAYGFFKYMQFHVSNFDVKIKIDKVEN